MDYLTNYYRHLSEQLQEKVNNLTKLLEAGNERHELHGKIVSHVLNQHVKRFPHITSRDAKGGNYGRPDVAASIAHATEFLNSYPKAPFTNPKHALNALEQIGAYDSPNFEDHIEDRKGHGPAEDQRRIKTSGVIDDYIEDLAFDIGELMMGDNSNN